jgi:hypothetical protein
VVLSVDEESQCGQHFSKILTEDAWNSLQAARDEESDPTEDEQDLQSSSSEDDDSSSSAAVSETPVQENPTDDAEAKPSTANADASQAPPETLHESEDEALENLSDVSDSADVGDVQLGSNIAVPITREDKMLARIDILKELLVTHPLMPRDPRNRNAAFLDMSSGVGLPDVHCAFEGCVWCDDCNNIRGSSDRQFLWGTEWLLFKHLM